MPRLTRTFALALIFAAGAALAHSGVKNPAVKARMQAMMEIGQSTKTLGNMSKGQIAFDAAMARAVGVAIADQAGRIPSLFQAREDDPKSEALPAIWDEFANFTALAADLEQAGAQAARIETTDDLRAALQQLGGACKDCHAKYRE